MMLLIEATKGLSSYASITLPEFNPDSTVDICLSERPLGGGSLIIALSTLSWLSQTCAATLFGVKSNRPKERENITTYASRLMTSLMARWTQSNASRFQRWTNTGGGTSNGLQ